MHHKAVVFDWGGVLMRTLDYGPRHVWDERLGLPAGSVEEVVHGIPEWRQVQLGLLDGDTYWNAVAALLKLTPEAATTLRSDFYRGDRLDLKLVALIRSLRERRIPVALLSNNSPALLDDLDALGVRGLFDPCVISCEIGVMKPDPEAYHAVLTAIGSPPEFVVLIDDSPANVDGACAIDMRAILFTPDVDLKRELEGWLFV